MLLGNLNLLGFGEGSKPPIPLFPREGVIASIDMANEVSYLPTVQEIVSQAGVVSILSFTAISSLLPTEEEAFAPSGIIASIGVSTDVTAE